MGEVSSYCPHASQIASARRALTKVVWILRLRLKTLRKRNAANQMTAFMRSAHIQSAAILAIRAFTYRVRVAQRLWRKQNQLTGAQQTVVMLQCKREQLRRDRAAAEDAALDDAGEMDTEGGTEDALEHDAETRSTASFFSTPLAEGPLQDAVRRKLIQRRKTRAALLADYRLELQAHEAFQQVNTVLRQASSSSETVRTRPAESELDQQNLVICRRWLQGKVVRLLRRQACWHLLPRATS